MCANGEKTCGDAVEQQAGTIPSLETKISKCFVRQSLHTCNLEAMAFFLAGHPLCRRKVDIKHINIWGFFLLELVNHGTCVVV
jgi:hypothetical protein